MSERWLRLYEGVVNDPKLQRLSGDTFKGLINLWCLASANDGRLPPFEDIAFALRMTGKKVRDLIDTLIRAGLIDETHSGNYRPHKWDERQFKSDRPDATAAERQRKHRDRMRGVTRDATVTVTNVSLSPEAETETETETETELEAAQPRETSTLDDDLTIPFALDRTPNKHERLERELREAAGLVDSPSSGLLDLSPIVEMLDKGWSLTGDILPVLRSKHRAGTHPDSWRYYVKPITEGKAKNDAIPSKPHGAPSGTSSADRAIASLARIRGQMGAPPGERSADSGGSRDSVELLSPPRRGAGHLAS